MKTIVLIFALAAAAPAYATPLYPSGREAGDVVEELRRKHPHDPGTVRGILGGHVRPYYAPSYMPPRVTRYGTPFYQALPAPSFTPSYTPPPVTNYGTPFYQAFPAPSFTPSYMPPPVTNFGTPFYQALP
jgi:hypothetical protein